MRAPARLGLYGVALAAAFATTFAVAGAVVPADIARGWAESQPAPGDDHGAGPGEGHGAGAGEGHGAGAGESHGDTGAGHQVPGLAVEQDGYRLTSVAAPSGAEAQGELSFTLLDPDGAPVTDYEVSHEKELHLIVVRTDGEHFRHVHPTTDGAGSWTMPWSWAEAGSYRLYADFVPTETGEELTLTSTVGVAGDYAPTTEPVESPTAEVDGFTVDLAGEVVAGQESMLTFAVRRDGAPVTTLQPYLGAYGHLVALRDGDLGYLHVHPMGEEPAGPDATSGPEVGFMAEAPSPGRYLLYLDFQVDGEVRTAEFVVTAR